MSRQKPRISPKEYQKLYNDAEALIRFSDEKFAEFRETHGDQVNDMSTRLFGITTLAMDYASTVVDITTQKRLSECKRWAREVKQSIEQYESEHKSLLGGIGAKFLEEEKETGLDFEDEFKSDFIKNQYAIDFEIGKLKLPQEDIELARAVYAAQVMIALTLKYAKDCDKFLESGGVPIFAEHLLLHKGFDKMVVAFSKLAVTIGLHPLPESVLKPLVGILYNRLLSCEVEAIEIKNEAV